MKVLASTFLMLVAAFAATNVQARYDGENLGNPLMPNSVNISWQRECSSCHIAYPPGLLPATSWKKLMADLDFHFGTNASLSPQDAKAITDFLVKNSSNRWTSKSSPQRITQSKWFTQKHGEIASSVWKRASVKSRSNCNACHGGASKGNFSERTVKVPR